MACVRCGNPAPMQQGRCPVCGASDAEAETIGPPPPASTAGSSEAEAETVLGAPGQSASRAFAPGGSGPLAPGMDFGSRYHIIRLLGSGGMGAVYQAWDKVLEVAVAVKVIRPESTRDPQAANALERRFKRELLLARQVTHRNVVRIHDLGEIDGIKYITMPYIQGSDLASVLEREGRLRLDRAVGIARQIAAGLAAAHDAGVVHRDLKPANVMIDAEGHAQIMDFGIARSTSGAMAGTMTVGGAIVGTVEYMAPEQARGAAVDQRADIYAFGLILNDMLLGRRQAGGQTAVAELMARMQQPPAPVRSIDPTIPPAIDALVTRCLQPDPMARYQRITDVLAELGAFDQGAPAGALAAVTAAATAPHVTPAKHGAGGSRWSDTRLRWAAVAGLIVVLAAGGWAWFGRGDAGGPAASGPAVSLAVVPFQNTTGDPSLDSIGASLSQVLTTELGQAAQVRAVPPDRLSQVLRDLRIAPNARLGPADLSRIAEFTGAQRVLSGSFSRFGEAIRIDATLQNLDSGQDVPLNAMAPNQAGLLDAVSKLAQDVRRDLAQGSTELFEELTATAWKPSTGSFEALRLYNEGQSLIEQGSYQEAQRRFEAALQLDGNFALASAGLARSLAALGYDAEARQASRQATSLAASLPAYEQHLISANHSMIVNDAEQAIASYEKLVEVSPNSAMLRFELGGLYEQMGQFDRASEELARVVELDPKFVAGLLARGRVEIRRGDPQGSLTHLTSALALADELQNDEARANILQAIGIAYKLLGRYDDALDQYQRSLAIKERLGNKSGMAASLGEIAQVHERLGRTTEAEKSLRAALALQTEIGDRSGMSTSQINLAGLLNDSLGRPDEALALLREALQIRRASGNPAAEALVLNNMGSVYLAKGEYAEAQTYYERALQLRETAGVPAGIADTRHNLGETFSRMGQYDQALTHYVRALEIRRDGADRLGAALESYSIGTVLDYQGNYGGAVSAKQEALQAFREAGQRDMFLGDILAGVGHSLTLSGRFDEAKGSLDESLAVARELQNPNLITQALRLEAERLFYAGDQTGAAAMAGQAAEAAREASDRSLQLLARTWVARVSAAGQPTRALASTFEQLAREADAAGLRAVAIACALDRSATLLAIGDRPGARQTADRALAQAETAGLRLAIARAHFLRAEIFQAAGQADARREYAQALRLLNEVAALEGNQRVLERADLQAMHAASERGAG